MGGDESCEFCRESGGRVLWEDTLCRVVQAPEPAYPGFTRVILQRHVREVTDLPRAERERLMRVVFAVEEAVREAMLPDKMNLASLGNVTPHVHWHVIPRFSDDRHFPAPVWAEPRRAAPHRPERTARAQVLADSLTRRLDEALRP
jgi:diadenosine tetraphosphate (Ap4A) HIT family hydrolase